MENIVLYGCVGRMKRWQFFGCLWCGIRGQF